MENPHIVRASQFLIQGYDDYIAARVLLNKGYNLQGATLAATSVEKYFKAILNALSIQIGKLHLSRLGEIRKAFESTDYKELFNYLDDTFLGILSEVYAFRYLDGMNKPKQFGFFVNQFLCELDYTVHSIESLIKIHNKDKPVSKLQRDIQSQNPDLFENNYLVQKIDKAVFMNKDSAGYGMYYDPKTDSPIELTGVTSKISIPYTGSISIISFNINNTASV